MKKLTALILAVLFVSGSSSHAAEYDPQHTMLALNMAIVSVHRILTTESRAVLEQEYSNIINNLSLGNIESDKDMTELYRDMLSIISRKRISEEDSKRLKSYYDTAEQRRITYALSNIRLAEAKAKASRNAIEGIYRETEAKMNASKTLIEGIDSETAAKTRASEKAINDISMEIRNINTEQNDIAVAWIGNMALSCVSFFTGDVFSAESMFWNSINAYDTYEALSKKKENVQRQKRQAEYNQASMIAEQEQKKRQAQYEQVIMKAEQERKMQTANDELQRAEIMKSNLKEEIKQDENMLKEELRLSQWQLERQDIADCNALQERLLQSSWRLLRQYKLPDEYRLTQNSLKNFYLAVQEQEVSKRSRMLRVLEDEFRVYPPYWYFRARTAQEAGNHSEARKFFAKFNEVWRPVLRRDPYKIEAAKFRIQEIIAEGKTLAETRDEILAQLEIISDNTPKDDWSDNLFMGVAYFILGEKNRGMDFIAVNLDFGYEKKISGMLFSQMEKGELDSSEAQKMIRKMGLQELIAKMKISDKDSALVMALYFDGNNEALEELANSNNNPVVFHALRLIEQSKGSSQNYAKVKEYVKRHEALKDKIRDSYSDILPLLNKYVNENRENAKIFMADMLMYGWGVEQDTKKAEEIFTELAENGNVYAQFVMIQNHLAPPAPPEPTPKPENVDVYSGIRKSAQAQLTSKQLEYLYDRGWEYYCGRGVTMDKKKAFEYFLRAAEGGHAGAQDYLGHMYRYGQGVGKDLQKARYWLQKAADQGNEFARNALNDMNARGR